MSSSKLWKISRFLGVIAWNKWTKNSEIENGKWKERKKEKRNWTAQVVFRRWTHERLSPPTIEKVEKKFLESLQI